MNNGACICLDIIVNGFQVNWPDKLENNFVFEQVQERSTTLNSGVSTGEMGVQTPTYVQTPPKISANPLKNFFIYRGVSHACIL